MDMMFSECVDALKNLRRSVRSNADPSIGMALDAVISKFESYDKASLDGADVQNTVGESLAIVSSILSCCASLATLMGRF